MKTPMQGLAVLGISLGVAAGANAAFIQPTSISAEVASGTININTPTLLINAATGNGGVNYSAPNPSVGGGDTPSSWYTSSPGTTPVVLRFDFATAQSLGELYLWDYYGHTPEQWNLKLFSGAGGAGDTLLDFNFSITPGPDSTSTKHVLVFSDDVISSFSGSLTTTINSAKGGVGLAEIGFTQVHLSTPIPAAAWLFGSGLLVLFGLARNRNA